MPEELETGGKEQAGVADQANLGEEAPDAAAQAGEEAPDAGESKDSIEGLKTGIQAERQKRQAAESQVMQLQQQFALLQQHSARPAQQQVATQQSYLKGKYGLEPYDNPTVEQIEDYGRYVENRVAQITQQGQVQASQQAFINSKADYSQVVGANVFSAAVGQVMFQPSAQMLEAMAADPSLAADYQRGALTPDSAYRAVKGYQATKELQQLQSQQQQTKTQRDAMLKLGPQPASSAGGAGAGGKRPAAAGYNDRETLIEALKLAKRAEQGEFG